MVSNTGTYLWKENWWRLVPGWSCTTNGRWPRRAGVRLGFGVVEDDFSEGREDAPLPLDEADLLELPLALCGKEPEAGRAPDRFPFLGLLLASCLDAAVLTPDDGGNDAPWRLLRPPPERAVPPFPPRALIAMAALIDRPVPLSGEE